MVPSHRDGTVKAYGVTAKEQLKQLPGVPSVVQALGPRLEVQFWQALFAPAATAKPVLEKLNVALRQAMHDPALLKSLGQRACSAIPMNITRSLGAKALFHSEIKHSARSLAPTRLKLRIDRAGRKEVPACVLSGRPALRLLHPESPTDPLSPTAAFRKAGSGRTAIAATAGAGTRAVQN